MRSFANEETRLHLWSHVREFAVPPSMIETATARRLAGDWAGACAAARFDVDVQPRRLAGTHGRELAARIRDDLRHLAPDLLRWHMPRIVPDGLLRPGLTVSLARYRHEGIRGGTLHLVARTAPAWADAGQRISLALWQASRGGAHPDRRFRLDLHRHLWDARRAGELRERSLAVGAVPLNAAGIVPSGIGCAVGRWASEAALLRQADGVTGPVAVRLGSRLRLALHAAAPDAAPRLEPLPGRGALAHGPVLPDAATWLPPDHELLRAGLIDADRLHPLVAAALVPGHRPSGSRTAPGGPGPRPVSCRGEAHRIGFVDGALAPLDHDPAEVRREQLLAALGGPPLPCLRAIDEAHRSPESLADIRARLDHGDTAGALAVVEALLGPDALLPGGPLREELAAAAQQRITHGLYRAGLLGSGPGPGVRDSLRRRTVRTRPRLATACLS
ncbi:hypothetical protein CS0771_55960 [Catellatospora sp. IY07-71]|uniref:hypothetical protein n=1 Tax=Catellatospora sp. IY07-71 TaxID=2728827 RepID=UPI001BB2F49E|nr:hypothetical protein [Catellatospora sp. IY07-71]BCJ76052.1 hypothetical protein CS0771_55960 [Catellatospora sp. IY07-71]